MLQLERDILQKERVVLQLERGILQIADGVLSDYGQRKWFWKQKQPTGTQEGPV